MALGLSEPPPEVRARINPALLGKKSLQTRLRMAASKRGVPRPQWVREKISRGRLAYYAAKRAVAETAGG